MQSELKPCPFCGDNERGMNCLMGSWTVGCSCGVLGGEYETEAEAITAWNARASDAEITRLTEALRAAEEEKKALPDYIDLFRIIRGAGRSNLAKAQAVDACLRAIAGAKP